MKILYAASEAVPFCKTGGLADVAGSLPPALAAEGAEVAVILPLYQRVKEKFGGELEFVCSEYIDLAWRSCYCGLFRTERAGVTWYFVDNEQYFLRPDLYGYDDDGERFGFFSRAVVKMLDHMGQWPDVIHCNDWQTALIPIYLKDDGVRDERYRSIKTTLSVHNIEYQGRQDPYRLGDLFGLNEGWVNDGTLILDGGLNLLKGAILCADAVNAVSPSYAEELKDAYYAHGMETIMQSCSHKLTGVLNGIDVVRYDPTADSGIAANFSAADLSGKAVNKAQLQKMTGLQEDPNVPVIGMVSRLVDHKGLDLVVRVFHEIMELPVQLVVLGTGDKKYEEFFRWAAETYPGRVSATLAYSEALSSAIYAGADLFLMPSKSEPCGLSQMIAMRYGALPIVRETGGLKDTVHAYEAWNDSGNGFSFAEYNADDMLYTISGAVALYMDDRDAFVRLQKRAMEDDFSWGRSARRYLNIYEEITGRPFEKAVETVPTEENVSAEVPAEKPKRKRAVKKVVPAQEIAPAEEKAEKPKRKRTVKKAEAAPETAPVEEKAEKPKRKTTAKKTAEKTTKQRKKGPAAAEDENA